MSHTNHIIRYEKLLLVTVLLELFLGGNGYLTEIAGVRLRVILYVICLLWAALRLLTSCNLGLPKQVWALLFLFAGTTTIGIMLGLANENGVEPISAELKALLYFPMILFFAVAIRDNNDIALVSRLIVLCGVIQALAYLSLLALMHSGTISYSTVYLFLKQSDEFVFRHNPDDVYFVGFFYKGAFHMCVAALFLLLDPVRKNRYLAALVLVAISFTLTRGIMAALIISLMLAIFFMPKRRWVATLVALGAVVTITLSFTDGFDYVRRPTSDEIRLADLSTFGSELDASMLIFGKGMGAAIGGRDRIEMTYLEILYKQGIIGLSLWIAVLFTNLSAFSRLSTPYRQHALVFCLATLYVFLATATNTFLTGSIGMSVVLLSTVILLVMNKQSSRAHANMAQS